MTGASAGEIPILDAVLPYIAVRVAKHKRWEDEEDEAEGGEGKKTKKQHGRKGRAKNQAVANAEKISDATVSVAAETKDVDMNDDLEDSAVVVPAVTTDALETMPLSTHDTVVTPTEHPEPILVLRRIQTVEVQGTQLIIFNAVGCVVQFLRTMYATF